jgi:TPP-dependent pyruvate/acetoin dehydrogenase alpha subunit
MMPRPIIHETRSVEFAAGNVKMTATVSAEKLGVAIGNMAMQDDGFDALVLFVEAVQEAREEMRNLGPRGRQPVPEPLGQ